MSHTKGPWIVDDNRGHICIRVEGGIFPHPQRAPGGWAVCSFNGPGMDVMKEGPFDQGGLVYSMSAYSKQIYEQQLKNAALISAAPEMLELVELLSRVLTNAVDPKEFGKILRKQVFPTLRKARGE